MKLIAPDLETAKNYNEKVWTYLQVVEKANGSRWSPLFIKTNDGITFYAIQFDWSIAQVFTDDELGKTTNEDDETIFSYIVDDTDFIEYIEYTPSPKEEF